MRTGLPRAAVALVPFVLVLGLSAEWVRYGPDTPVLGGVDTAPRWIADLATGWLIAAAGFAAWARFPMSRVGPLLVLTGCLWFATDFTGSDIREVAWVATQARLLYVGTLIQVLVTYPSGRARTLAERATVVLGYAAVIGLGAAVPEPLWADSTASILIVTLVLGTVVYGYASAKGAHRRARLLALQLTLVLWTLLIVRSLTGRPGLGVSQQATLITETVLVIVSVALTVGLARAYRRPTKLTDVVVQLGHGGSASQRNALAHILGDPDLQLGYRFAGDEAYLTAEGAVLDLNALSQDRVSTLVERDGQPVAVIVHDRTLLEEPGLLEATSAAARLESSNDRLRAEVQAQLQELELSRRRLVVAGDEERRRLEMRLRDGAQREVESLAATLRSALMAAQSSGGDQTVLAIARADAQLERVLDDTRDIARGLHPGFLAEEGLAAALESLAEGSGLPVRLSVTAGNASPEAAAAAWYMCSEALTNIAKHSLASCASIDVRAVDETLFIEITDDGTGTADVNMGSGLRGLADRAEALGGSFVLDSRPGVGTRIRVTIPVTPAASRQSSDAGTVASISVIRENTPAGTDAVDLVASDGGRTNHHMEADHA